MLLLLSALLCVATASRELLTDIPLTDDEIAMVAAAPPPQKNAALIACLDIKFNSCQGTFNQIFNPTDPPLLNYRNGTVFLNMINNLLQTNVSEVLKVCNQRQQFYQCMGEYYYPCTYLFSILQRPNTDYQNSFDYTRTWMGLEFLCNAGFEEVVTQWSCLAGIPGTKMFNNCQTTFNNTVNPNNLCSVVQSTGACFNDVYNAICQDQGAGYFGCEQFRFTFDQICYDTRCKVGF